MYFLYKTVEPWQSRAQFVVFLGNVHKTLKIRTNNVNLCNILDKHKVRSGSNCTSTAMLCNNSDVSVPVCSTIL